MLFHVVPSYNSYNSQLSSCCHNVEQRGKFTTSVRKSPLSIFLPRLQQDSWRYRGDIRSATHDFEMLVEADGMLTERRDTVVAPFTGPLAHLFTRLDTWASEQRDTLRAEIKTLVGL